MTVHLWRRGGRDARGVDAWWSAQRNTWATPLLHAMEPRPEGRLRERSARPQEFRGLARGAPPEERPPLDGLRVFWEEGAVVAACDEDGVGCRWVEWRESAEAPAAGWEGPFVATRTEETVYLLRDLARFGLSAPDRDAKVNVLRFHVDGALVCWRLMPVEGT